MSEQLEHLEDPEEVNILRAINRGEKRWDEPDWQSYLSSIVKMIGLMNPPISYIGCVWALLNEIDNSDIRIHILSKWQDLAPKCFPTQEAADDFIADMDCLVRTNIELGALIVLHGAKMPHTYDKVDGGKGLNELALVWADQYVSATDMVALASEIHNTVSAGEKDPMIEYFLYSSRNRDQMPFENIYDFSRNLFLAESFRQYLTTGKMYTSAPLGFADIKRKLRNACFEEYIRLRIAQIEAEMEDDNLLLLDPTTEDYYQELYQQERSVVDREEMFESFRGSQAYSARYYRGRPEVLQMIQYFMEYLNWKMQNLNNETMKAPNQTININGGDYVAGNKYTGDVFGNIAPGGVGKKVYYGVQEKQADAPTETKAEESSSQEQDEYDGFEAGIRAVYEANVCNQADWAVVVKIMEEKGEIQKSAFSADAEYINRICGKKVTTANSLSRSPIFTKITGEYPNWSVRQSEQNRETAGKLQTYLQIGKIFTDALND